ncbi:MAG TPA: hypothetical protein VNG13_14095 [Mycobacteriales bacterium]|nr:hypothetical protein [Mycobacteriales bacterium]
MTAEEVLGALSRTGVPRFARRAGTAATGKSTTAMRIALGLDTAGRSVASLDTLEGDRRVPRIVAAAAAMRAEWSYSMMWTPLASGQDD